ncbi:alpha-mannosidase [Paenibacillus eucommiae]|uniref:Alpha-mannosidase n=1 Tax=Paenibacillus eucommiae TaxID=1355755 RepID=A0ABS4J725_9BACL|nr:alpha-mannosidase [Paenibacillus eucommiae]MBP1995608.1 alpha-mannosidase [Paenibacillus eucommiae]
MFLTFEKIGRRIHELDNYRYSHHLNIPTYEFLLDEEAEVAAMPPSDAKWGEISVGERWTGWDVTAWLKTEVVIPQAWGGKTVLGLFDFGKTGAGHNSGFESLLYVDGRPFQGVGSNHKEVFFPESLVGQKIELLFKIWSGLNGDTGEKTVLEHKIEMSALAILENDTDDLYHTALAAWHTVDVLGENSWERQAIMKALDRAFLLLDWSTPGDEAFYESIVKANVCLNEELAALPKNNPVTVRCIGHTHIDVAWLWRLKHTREKAARSFSTVLRLMEKYPEYIFLQTQPQLYEYIEQDYPEIFASIQERVREGRWEAGGAMWLESDCNIPSGESLVRQLVYGMRYFESKFDVKCEYLWLPDVFGYSWAMPQILQKSGLRHFMTTKISWNVYNRFPHDTFYWRGIDGTEIMTHYITTPDPNAKGDKFTKFYTYNGQVLPSTVTGIWNNYRDKEINDDELLLSYGWGDGGGGPTRTMLEMRRRLEHMPGIPKATTGRADEFFNQLEQKVAATDRYVHHWDGELYLELHRGTYTSQAYVKRMNRRMEFLLRDAEALSTFNMLHSGSASYPEKLLYDSWKIVLRNQFHDILPGSSITEVYEDCRVEYAEAEQLAVNALENSFNGLVSGISQEPGGGLLVFNSLPWVRDELIELPWEERFAGLTWRTADGSPLLAERLSKGEDGEKLCLLVKDIPALGYTTVRSAAVAPNTTVEAVTSAEATTATTATAASTAAEVRDGSVSTPFYEIEWNEAGQITRLFDKRSEREILAEGAIANRFDVHEDKPVLHDNWEIDIFYTEKVRHVTDIQSIEIAENHASRTVIRFEWKYGKTTIWQDMILYTHNPRIDFSTRVDWQERETLLKVAFPVRIRAAAATYEIQFGHVERPTHWNTSWDYARFETCAQKWVDLSERGCGVSLLNDCKYGHDIKDNVMRLTLIKSSNRPDPECDRGEHIFTYALLPHEGDWFAAGTVQQAYRLNVPVIAFALPEAVEGEAARETEYGIDHEAELSGTTAGSTSGSTTGSTVGSTVGSTAGSITGSTSVGGRLPEAVSYLSVEGDHVMIDTVKRAEDSNDWIIRCYEYAGKRGAVSFNSHYTITKVDEVNLAEREAQSMVHESHSFGAFFKPFELKTFRVTIAAPASP